MRIANVFVMLLLAVGLGLVLFLLLRLGLHQAQALAPAAQLPGGDAALTRFKAEFAAKRQAWEQLAAPDAGAQDLLAGLPPAVREQARTAAADEGRTTALLKTGVSLELLLALAALRNPDAQAAQENWRATLRHFDQAAYLEDLVTQYRAFVRELDTLVGPQTHKEMLAMTFAFPSVLSLKGQVVDAEARLA
jgi:hypothetical protein